MRDDDYNIYQITRYYGISLFNSCYYQQDYFRAVEYSFLFLNEF